METKYKMNYCQERQCTYNATFCHIQITTVATEMPQYVLFLGALAKLWKSTIWIVMVVYPSAHMEQLSYHWTDMY